MPPALFDDGDDVRRLPGLADPDDQGPGQARGRGVVGEQRRRGEADREPVVGAEHVLRVAGSVVGGATRRDHDRVRSGRGDRGGRGIDLGTSGGELTLERSGLLADLLFEQRRHG